jgi:hypothetical protein
MYEKEKLTADEADRALAELVETDETVSKNEAHIWEVLEKIGKL